jgi:hypothetical protein
VPDSPLRLLACSAARERAGGGRDQAPGPEPGSGEPGPTFRVDLEPRGASWGASLGALAGLHADAPLWEGAFYEVCRRGWRWFARAPGARCVLFWARSPVPEEGFLAVVVGEGTLFVRGHADSAQRAIRAAWSAARTEQARPQYARTAARRR